VLLRHHRTLLVPWELLVLRRHLLLLLGQGLLLRRRLLLGLARMLLGLHPLHVRLRLRVLRRVLLLRHHLRLWVLRLRRRLGARRHLHHVVGRHALLLLRGRLLALLLLPHVLRRVHPAAPSLRAAHLVVALCRLVRRHVALRGGLHVRGRLVLLVRVMLLLLLLHLLLLLPLRRHVLLLLL